VIASCEADIVALRELDVGRARTGGVDQAQVQATFPTRAPFRCIDHVFVNHRIEVLAASAIGTPLARVASDHLPLVVDFRIAELIEAGVPRGSIGQVDGGGT
jgi:endonuclease/exonuclease/phosphatase family metal-dependent hydrolase